MITRCKALLVVAGDFRNELMPIIRNHEALVEISDGSEIAKIWRRNKTPIVNADNFFNICCSYDGRLLIFDTDEYIKDKSQPAVTEAITKFCYSYQIEPGEFKIKNVANNSSEGCLFCGITTHPGQSTVAYNMGCKFVDMIIYESPNFVVVPGLGPLAPGYLMIMTKDHYLSLAQIPKELFDEYYQIEKDIESILTAMYGKGVAFYEHGTGPGGAVGLKSIVHMHIHVMLDNQLKDEYKEMFCMHPIADIKDVEPISYFSYKWGSDGEFLVTDDPEVYLQRQVHRQIYAEEHNLAKDQFNWRKTEFAEMTHTNVWQLYKYLSTAELDARVKARTYAFVEAGKLRF